MNKIHLSTPDRNTRVLDVEEARSLWEKGEVQDGCLYWMEGMPDWKPVTELFGAKNPAVEQKKRRYVLDPKGLTRFVVVMLWIFFAVLVATLVSNIGMKLLLSRPYTVEEATANDLRQNIIQITYFIVFLITAISFLKWKVRAAKNSVGFGAKSMTNFSGDVLQWIPKSV